MKSDQLNSALMNADAVLCSRDDVADMLLAPYLDACEAQNPGLVERTILAVSAELVESLASRYPQPWAQVPSLVRHIARVFTAYRVVQAITSLVQTEASSNNEWLPLQQEWKQCVKMLEDILGGRRSLTLSESLGQREDACIAVCAPRPLFAPGKP